MKNYLSLFFLVVFVALPGRVAEAKKIELTDGSTLDGEVVAFADGKYTVKTSTLGTLQIEDSKVRALRQEGAVSGTEKEGGPLDASSAQREMQKIQPAITGDPEIMKTVAGLLSNPDFRALAQDPEILQAAKSLDIKTLEANPQFMKALQDPAVQDIRQKIAPTERRSAPVSTDGQES